MIEKLGIRQASAIWSIDGVKISMFHRLKVEDDTVISNITEYKKILQDNLYQVDNTRLCKIFLFLGGISFVGIGYKVYKAEFARMFKYYTNRFVTEWSIGDKIIHSKEVGVKYVFEMMLRNATISIKYDFNYILGEIDDSHSFCQIVDDEFEVHWTDKLKKTMLNREDLRVITSKIGFIRVAKYCLGIYEITTEYLKIIANSYTIRREIISENKLHDWIFGDKLRTNFTGCNEAFSKALEMVVKEEFKTQCEKFIAENHLELNVHNDVWVLYKKHGPSLHYNKMDFSIIKSTSLRLEIKYYMKYRCMGTNRINDRFLSQISYAANLLTDHNSNIKFFADIDDVDAKALHLALEAAEKTNCGREKSQVNVMIVFSTCKLVCAYLIGNMRDENIKSPQPHHNPFAKFVFVNLRDYIKNTPIIPETVVKQMETHICELPNIFQLLFKIFSETGMRAKEALFLESDCLERSKYDGFVQLKYKPYKVLSARRKANAGDCHRILISTSLADEINVQIKSTQDLQEEYGLPYIFIKKRPNFKANMLNICYFLVKLNELIKKYGISDESGELWHFTSRQYRKTLAVTLIENGATIEELAYWLGHLNRGTAAKYYAEVRKMKLAELNTQFFREKFDLIMSKEQLALYSEDERRLLYIDFRLEQRKVEFGYCLKKLADGGCNNRSSMYNCVNCKNLCTGEKYLSYWQELLLQQQAVVNALLEAYAINNITGFDDFKEYKQEHFLFECYQNIVTSIIDGKVVK